MQHTTRLPIYLLSACSLCLPSLGSADASLTYADNGLGGAQERKTVLQIHADKVRMEEMGSGIYSLYDHTKQTLYTVNTQHKQFIETTAKKVQERVAKANEIQEQMKAAMQQQMAQMPAEQRNALQQQLDQAEKQAELMKKTPPPKFELQTNERTDKVNEIACQISTVTTEGQPMREVCAATDSPIAEQDYKMLLNMFEYMDNIAREMATAQGAIPPSAGSATLHKNGLALRIKTLPEGPSSQLIEVSTASLAAATFNIPADYQAFEPMDAATPPPPPAQPAPVVTIEPPKN